VIFGVAGAIGVSMSLIAPAAFAQSATPLTLSDYLRSTIGLDASEIADARGGKVAVTLLHTDVSRDVTVFGMVGIHVTQAAYVAHMRDLQSVIAARAQRFGVIRNPVQPEDLAGFSFDESEWDDLKSCKKDDCDFKLPESLMHQFSQSVNWGGPHARQEVDSVMRSDMSDLVAAYRERGNAAMLRYDDTHGVLASDAFDALLGQSQFLQEYTPAFRNYLLNYPSSQLDGATNAIYWSVDNIPHLRPTFTLNQMVVYTPAAGTPLLARKQIYADHYFEASLEVSAVFDAPDLAGGPGIYLVSVRRYRFDSLPRGFLNIRGRVRSQLQKIMRSDLERERKTTESRPPA
jgi:hypothetical protein